MVWFQVPVLIQSQACPWSLGLPLCLFCLLLPQLSTGQAKLRPWDGCEGSENYTGETLTETSCADFCQCGQLPVEHCLLPRQESILISPLDR